MQEPKASPPIQLRLARMNRRHCLQAVGPCFLLLNLRSCKFHLPMTQGSRSLPGVKQTGFPIERRPLVGQVILCPAAEGSPFWFQAWPAPGRQLHAKPRGWWAGRRAGLDVALGGFSKYHSEGSFFLEEGFPFNPSSRNIFLKHGQHGSLRNVLRMDRSDATRTTTNQYQRLSY